MVIVHGSGGVTPGEWEWRPPQRPRHRHFRHRQFHRPGLEETETDQFRLSPAADVAGALARFACSRPSGIDPKRIGVIGFSRGGIVALDTALEPFRRGVINGDLRFAAHIPFYPSCDINFVSAHLDGSPILMLLGGKDNYTPAAPCLAYADELRDKNVPISVVVYANAYHAFDRNTPLKYFPNDPSARNCRGAVVLDAGTFTMGRADTRCTGSDTLAEVKQCFTTGVTTVAIPRAAEGASRGRSLPQGRVRTLGSSRRE